MGSHHQDEISGDLEEEDEDLQRSSLNGVAATLPPNPDPYFQRENMPLGQAIPARRIAIPFGLGILWLAPTSIELAETLQQMLSIMLILLFIHCLYRSDRTRAQDIPITPRIAHIDVDELNYNAIDDLIVVNVPIPFSETVTVHFAAPIDPGAHQSMDNLRNPSMISRANTSNEDRRQVIPAQINNVSSATIVGNRQIESLPVQNTPTRVETDPSTLSVPTTRLVNDNSAPRLSGEVNQSHVINIETPLSSSDISHLVRVPVQTPGEPHANAGKRTHEDDDESMANPKRRHGSS